jgi:hypothetical protein
MTDIPKIVQERLQAAAKTEVHLDPDLLTAFAENSLAGCERVQVLQHLAQCAACRDVVSLALPQVELTHSTRPARSPWLSWPVLRWGALATCVVIVGAAVTLRHERSQETALFVEEKAPAPPAPPPAKLTVESQVSPQPTQKWAAKIAPPSPFQPRRDSGAAGKLAKQREGADARSAAVASTMKAMKPLRNDQPANPAVKFANSEPVGQMAAVAPASPPAPKAANAEAPTEERKDNLDYTARASKETVTVETQSVAVAAQAAPGKAQNASAGVLGGVSGDQKADAAGTRTETVSGEYDKLSRAGNKTAPRWTLSPDGALQRSFDSGRTWQTIPVASAVTFRALAANDSDIWVGGAAGVLYHSSDAGQHWTQIKLVGDGKPLTADIITVEFTDSRHGKLTTDDHETWTTIDGGESWRRR